MVDAYDKELDLALRSIHRASLVTKQVLRSLKNNVSAESKADDSPVTIADFAAQCLIISALHASFPSDQFLGEESATALRSKESLRSEVWKLVSQVPRDGNFADLAVPEKFDEMLDLIDLGCGCQSGQGRVWVMDPVDGTATFMKGQQYAVCLCLLVDGVQKVGAIGCPNLPFETATSGRKIREEHVDSEGCGVIISAVEGHGSYVRPMTADSIGTAQKINPVVCAEDVSHLDFVESWPETSSQRMASHEAVAKKLGAQWPGTELWSLQMKYMSLALGATDVMVRIPKGRDRYTQIWDHAGGQLIYTETGGVIKDLDGGAIDFGQGRALRGERNFGLIAARPAHFEVIFKAAHEVVSKDSR
ncbi:hypothetical protein LTS18_003431 [Coniosporium uncinatum]|uniref:Uncharacterized protein n=1 Tax=Coniosporium uncinatum TaxID=93489 RepID=A0ACC3DTE4_9PEZI|nr:hypothetical protein LTS18_003431 [Coniosporium uncinatum]